MPQLRKSRGCPKYPDNGIFVLLRQGVKSEAVPLPVQNLIIPEARLKSICLEELNCNENYNSISILFMLNLVNSKSYMANLTK